MNNIAVGPKQMAVILKQAQNFSMARAGIIRNQSDSPTYPGPCALPPAWRPTHATHRAALDSTCLPPAFAVGPLESDTS